MTDVDTRARPELHHSAGYSVVRVFGTPSPKGSKSVWHGRVVDDARGYAPWKSALDDAAAEWRLRRMPMLDGALIAEATFYLPRPASSRFGDLPAGPPDLDKLIRSIGDPFSKVLWADDARIVTWLRTAKLWADRANAPGVLLRVWRHSL